MENYQNYRTEGHRWFIGVQFHPELLSKPLKPHPIFNSFIKESLKERIKMNKPKNKLFL